MSQNEYRASSWKQKGVFSEKAEVALQVSFRIDKIKSFKPFHTTILILYTPRSHQKTSGFLFSGVLREKERPIT